MMPKTVYVSIGNTDDKLGQHDWSRFVSEVDAVVRLYAAEVYGEWYSVPYSKYQNACWGFSIGNHNMPLVREKLSDLANEFLQNSIAWSEVTQTDFLN